MISDGSLSLFFFGDLWKLRRIRPHEWVASDGAVSITVARITGSMPVWSVYLAAASVLGIGEHRVLRRAIAIADEDFRADKMTHAQIARCESTP